MSCSPCSPPLCREIYGQAVADLTAFTSKGLGLVCVGLGKTGVKFFPMKHGFQVQIRSTSVLHTFYFVCVCSWYSVLRSMTSFLGLFLALSDNFLSDVAGQGSAPLGMRQRTQGARFSTVTARCRH